jgi:hypothetical protein
MLEGATFGCANVACLSCTSHARETNCTTDPLARRIGPALTGNAYWLLEAVQDGAASGLMSSARWQTMTWRRCCSDRGMCADNWPRVTLAR